VQVFISYSHNDADTPLARYLAARFRAIGIEVWQDESSQPAGESLQADIEKAVLDSDHGVFIVSKLWLLSRWSRLELERFDRRDRTRVRRIPVLRLPREQLNLPMEMIDLKGVVWLENDQDADARFWEVYCAVTGTDPGPTSEWRARSRALGTSPAPVPVVQPTTPTLDSLRCNRGVQWKTMADVSPDQSHDLLIVPGEVGQAHDHFCRRIRELLPMVPPRNMLSVHWRKRPVSRDEFYAALAEPLRVPLEVLTREMSERMSDSNLILLHPCIRARFVDAPLISYYTEWLPALLRDVHPRMSLKCVQPVEWPAEAGVVTNVLSWMHLGPPGPDEGRPEAEKFIGIVRAGASPSLRTIRMQNLADITDADLDEFCQLENLNDPQKEWFLSQIKSRRPKTSQEVFDAIDAFLSDARR
jgi:hypothetical protein